jgi:hypothetical protein
MPHALRQQRQLRRALRDRLGAFLHPQLLACHDQADSLDEIGAAAKVLLVPRWRDQ